MKHEAIYNLYPNVTKINGDVAMDNNDNIIEYDVSAVDTKTTELETAEANEKQAKIDLKASAKAKLMAGEALTEDEANVMIGG
jgi:hypothetical protein